MILNFVEVVLVVRRQSRHIMKLPFCPTSIFLYGFTDIFHLIQIDSEFFTFFKPNPKMTFSIDFLTQSFLDHFVGNLYLFPLRSKIAFYWSVNLAEFCRLTFFYESDPLNTECRVKQPNFYTWLDSLQPYFRNFRIFLYYPPMDEELSTGPQKVCFLASNGTNYSALLLVPCTRCWLSAYPRNLRI
jgi:hypothetical protein